MSSYTVCWRGQISTPAFLWVGYTALWWGRSSSSKRYAWLLSHVSVEHSPPFGGGGGEVLGGHMCRCIVHAHLHGVFFPFSFFINHLGIILIRMSYTYQLDWNIYSPDSRREDWINKTGHDLLFINQADLGQKMNLSSCILLRCHLVSDAPLLREQLLYRWPGSMSATCWDNCPYPPPSFPLPIYLPLSTSLSFQ